MINAEVLQEEPQGLSSKGFFWVFFNQAFMGVLQPVLHSHT